eukprot:GHVP01069084.1.p2 GENE.GHVP01069084.1~~GHVP01069084.1.p2  ORF type:complete len:191 (+),score=64.68 GHVP01069084.1:30-602(+)
MTKDFPDAAPYTFLGIEAGASKKDIKKAYRLRALELHPDKNPDDEDAAKKFLELQGIYEFLVDDKKRAELDKKIYAEKERQKRWETVDKEKKLFGDRLFQKEQEAQKKERPEFVNMKRQNEEYLNEYVKQETKKVRRKIDDMKKSKDTRKNQKQNDEFEDLENETMRLLLEASRKQKAMNKQEKTVIEID